jgi:putative transposase
VNKIATTAVDELRDVIGVSRAVDLFGIARSTYYAEPVAPEHLKPRNGGVQPNALTNTERQAVLDVLHADVNVDQSPYSVYASLLDDGKYLASIRSFYRVLEQNGETTQRMNQRSASLPRPVPVLCATKPKEIWSWDISPIVTTMKRKFFYLYAVIDLYSRFVPGWCLEEVEDKDLARELFENTCRNKTSNPTP